MKLKSQTKTSEIKFKSRPLHLGRLIELIEYEKQKNIFHPEQINELKIKYIIEKIGIKVAKPP